MAISLKALQAFKFKPAGNIRKDATAFLVDYKAAKTAGHCSSVARKARELARQFGADETKAETAGWLHDISAVIPDEDRLKVAQDNNIEILPEEEIFPMIIHQKLSRLIAREVFLVTDEDVLSAIECHTTLKAHASILDKVVFVADKIAWDSEGQPPYLKDLLEGLTSSLDNAALVYLDFLWEQRETLPVLHPWVIEARESLKY